MTAQMISGFGKFHTNDADPNKPGKKLTPYVPIDLAGIRTLVDKPQCIDKSQAQWLIPSTLHSRKKTEQEVEGEFWLLWADIDQGECDEAFFVGDARHKSIDEIEGLLAFVILDCADFEMYASRSATEDRQKCRIMVPLDKPLAGGDWSLCQEVLNAKLRSVGIISDDANLSCNQVMYLPNRGAFYKAFSERSGVCFDPMATWVNEVAEARKALTVKAAEVERRKAEALERRQSLRYDPCTNPIDAFNAAYSVEEILLQHGYDQRGDSFKHPDSETGGFSATVLNGRVHSMSSSDPLYTEGGGVGAHDAFSAYCVLQHGGELNKAIKDAGDNLLFVDGGISWNRAKQREYMQAQERLRNAGDTSATPGAKAVASVAQGIVVDEITLEEMHAARLTPRVILRDLLYADVRTRIAAGGVGKTTIAIFEAVTLALGRDLWGRTPDKQCRSVLVTREDSREILVARMREIIRTMQLTPEGVEIVLASIKIVDVSGVSFRLSAVNEDVVVPHTVNLEWIVEALAEWKPDWIIFDPLVSFGVGESRVNDAEQGLIEAFRVLRNRLDCCIEGIHHSGKANAREKNLDQYAGRGGSALSDGSRMVVVMQPLTPEEWNTATGSTLGFEETGIVMALSKLSYAGKQDPIFIRRDGYNFEMVTVMRRSPDQIAKSIEEQVCQFITYEYSQGRKYTAQDLDNSKEKLNLSRNQIRQAITALKVSGRVIYVEVKGRPGSHFQPVTLADDGGDTQSDLAIDGGY